ncbi:hypothetical protein A3D03_06625 [Candidatus Gottesmanbacteria bacterium RIFCSPHIGHO2_02_FULL_40_13]|uniref:Winged helix-turn-helix domain-containing protein n=1 Tax=Candidatus Gottesmanbacteria bacterium RIFCSPHIGHO2_02_FULL_40_13 TaxID=1798384 RepID=A0A1F6A9D9_9BACT|nr:MAG: hypothetical protein A3D03_06625 [Candidatus Gottesmanbacteria bacterium RIFCSPHIGHO2_02_FULL_40_13]
MLKIELIWRELLYRAIDKRQPEFSITELAERFSLSTSVVSHALFPLRELKMVKIEKTSSQITDSEKLLFFWATRRKLEKDIIYSTYNPQDVFSIESLMPAEAVPTAFSACRLFFNINPAEYDKIFYYVAGKEDVLSRFPDGGKNKANVIFLKKDKFMESYEKIPMAQVFVDLWSLPEWYARDFREVLLTKIKSAIGL